MTVEMIPKPKKPNVNTTIIIVTTRGLTVRAGLPFEVLCWATFWAELPPCVPHFVLTPSQGRGNGHYLLTRGNRGFNGLRDQPGEPGLAHGRSGTGPTCVFAARTRARQPHRILPLARMPLLCPPLSPVRSLLLALRYFPLPSPNPSSCRSRPHPLFLALSVEAKWAHAPAGICPFCFQNPRHFACLGGVGNKSGGSRGSLGNREGDVINYRLF